LRFLCFRLRSSSFSLQTFEKLVSESGELDISTTGATTFVSRVVCRLRVAPPTSSPTL
jgi:hypothetical protein